MTKTTMKFIIYYTVSFAFLFLFCVKPIIIRDEDGGILLSNILEHITSFVFCCYYGFKLKRLVNS